MPLSRKFLQRFLHHRRLIDNGPMEGFWGILKREKYYGSRFTSKQELVRMILDYIYLLQHPAGTAQSWCCYANGKVPDGIFCVKKSAKSSALGSKILFYFIVRLTGCGSPCGISGRCTGDGRSSSRRIRLAQPGPDALYYP